MTQGSRTAVQPRPASRERLLTAAYELFSQRGIRAVGTEELMERAGVAKATFYRYFRSKTGLVLAFLEERERQWTFEFVRDGARSRGDTPTEWLLGILRVFDDWFHERSRARTFEGCSFVNVLVEFGPEHPIGQACIAHLDTIRGILADWAAQAGLRDPDEFARAFHLLMKGSIICAGMGDREAARRALPLARHLIALHTPAEATVS